MMLDTRGTSKEGSCRTGLPSKPRCDNTLSCLDTEAPRRLVLVRGTHRPTSGHPVGAPRVSELFSASDSPRTQTVCWTPFRPDGGLMRYRGMSVTIVAAA